MIPLKYQTSSQVFKLGPFISTDGDTESTALAIANTDVLLYKCNSTVATAKSTTGLTAIQDGFYGGLFSSDDTDTYGELVAYVHVATALYVKEYFRVMSENEYDSVTSTTTFRTVNVSSMNTGIISSAQISSGAISSLTFGIAALTSDAFSSGWISSLSFNTGAITTQALSSGAISTLTISTAMTDVIAHSVWAESTKILTAFSTGLWSTAFFSTAFWSTAFNSTAFFSTAFWSTEYFSTNFYSTTIIDADVDATWDEARGDHISTDSMGYTQSTLYSPLASISTINYDEISSVNWSRATRELTALSSTVPSTGLLDYISNVTWANSTKTLSTTQSFDLTGNITGSLSGSVGSVSSMSTTILDDIFGVYADSTETIKSAIKLIRAASVGLSSGGGSTQVKFYDASETVARITADVSTESNRTVIVTDLT